MKFYKNVQVPVKFGLKLNQSFEDDGDTYLEFLASNNTTSLSNHRMELSSLEQMRNQAPNLPVFLNHSPDAVVGKIASVKPSSPDKFIPRVKLFHKTGDMKVDQPINQLNNWLNQGIVVGASIGASILAYSLAEENNKQIVSIKDVKLIEVSLTAIPALEATKGTLSTCKNGMCNQIAQQVLNQSYNLGNNNFGDDKMEIKQLAEQIKYKKYTNAAEKRKIVMNLQSHLDKIELAMDGKINSFKMDEYSDLEADKKILVDVLQGLDPMGNIRRGGNPF